jgi:hypothetical protein
VCGNVLSVLGTHLRNKNTQSCGCWQREAARKANTTHGRAGMAGGKPTPTYKIWEGMRQRCLNPHNHKFRDYGGRGITICERWHDFSLFLADMGERPSPQHSIDRWPNNNGNYEPGNCRWATRKEQMNNTRHNVILAYHDVALSLTQWAERIGIQPTCLLARIRRGWTVEQILTRPWGHVHKTHCLHGHEFTAENTRTHLQKKGGVRRICKRCSRENMRHRRAQG